jgi:hypothetical protein
MWMVTWQALSVTPYQQVKQQRKEYDDVLWKTNGHVKLCAGSYSQKVDMSTVNSTSGSVGQHTPTVTVTLVWLEITSREPPPYGRA